MEYLSFCTDMLKMFMMLVFMVKMLSTSTPDSPHPMALDDTYDSANR